MSFDLLLEFPNEVVKVVPIEEEFNNLNLKSASIILLKNSVSIINSETGYIYRSYELTKRNNSTNVDCIYLKDSRSLLVALSDSSLVLIPEGAKKATEYNQVSWPVQPMRLYTSGNDVIVFSEGGLSAQFALTTDNELPSVSAAKNIVQASGTVSAGNNHLFVTASLSGAVVASSSSKKGKKDTSSSAELAVTSYPTTSLLPGASLWLSGSTGSQFKVQLAANEKLRHIIAHKQCNSISLVIHNSESKSTRWVKSSASGSVLFERQLAHDPVSVTEVGDQLWFVFAHNHISHWDVRFGAEIRVFNLTTLLTGVSYVLPFGYSYNAHSSGHAAIYPCHVLLCSLASTGDSTVVYRHTLSSDSQSLRSSLCGAIGKLSSSVANTLSADNAQPFNISIYDDSKKDQALAAADDESSGAGGRVLAGLPGPMKRKLKQLKAQYEEQVQLELKESESNADVVEPTERFEKKARKFYLDIPDSVSRAFLVRLESAKHSDLVSSDWDLVKVLVRSGTISLASNPSLISQATEAHRLDVLAQIVRYVSDLTEKQCVKILHLCLFAPDSALDRVNVVHGVIQWGSSQTPTETETKTDKTPKKKDKKAAKEVDSAEPTISDNRLLILRAMLESVVYRSAAFSTVLLSEAIRLLTPATCSLLLRVLAFTLRGLTSPVNDTAVHLSGRLGDDQIKRAITWMEALLDGHFSATALQASVHAPTRRALTSAMQAVNNAEVAAEELERAMGLWTHISRVIHNGSEQAKPIAGLYQVEQLTF